MKSGPPETTKIQPRLALAMTSIRMILRTSGTGKESRIARKQSGKIRRRTRTATKRQVTPGSEFNVELDLTLSVLREVGLGRIISDLAEGTVADVAVKSLELRAVECVEEIDAEHGFPSFRNREILNCIQIFKIHTRITHS